MRITGHFALAFVLSILSFATSDEAHAGFERRFVGVRTLGSAGAMNAFGDGPWCFYFNPAHTSDIGGVSLFYVPSVFGLSEVSSTGLSYRGNSLDINYSVAAHTFGFKLYRETVMSVNGSVPLYDFLFIGVNANFNHLFIKEYGTDLAVSVDAGSKMFLSDNFVLGISATNINSASMTALRDRLPQTVAGGVAFLSTPLNLGIDYYKEVGFPSQIRIAAEYSPLKYMTVRMGSASGTSSFNAGLSVRLSAFEIEYGAMFHQVLGITQAFGINFKFGGRGEPEFERIRNYRESLRK